MFGFLHRPVTQRTPRLQGEEGGRGKKSLSSVRVEEACYIQLPRVDEGDAAAQQAIYHTQTGHPKMSASASSDQVPLLQDDEQGLVEPQLPDVTDGITKAPRRIEQVPLVGAPAADDWEPTEALKDTIKKAIKESDAEGLRKALDDLSPEQVEKALTTGEWKWGSDEWEQSSSAIHYAARECEDVAVFEVLLHTRRHLLNLEDDKLDRTPLHLAAAAGSVDVVEKFIDGAARLFIGQQRPGQLVLRRSLSSWAGRSCWKPLHWAAEAGSVGVAEKFVELGGKELLEVRNNVKDKGVSTVEGRSDVVEKFIELGGKELLEAKDKDGDTVLHDAAYRGRADVTKAILVVDPGLLDVKNNGGKTPFNIALAGQTAPTVTAMITKARGSAGKQVMQLLGTSGRLRLPGTSFLSIRFRDPGLELMLQPGNLLVLLPFIKEIVPQHLRQDSESPGLDTLHYCSALRELMKSRVKDSLTDEIVKTADWLEGLTTSFCTDTIEADFRQSLQGKEEEWFELLDSAEPKTVVIQANCIYLTTYHWQKPYPDYQRYLRDDVKAAVSPRTVFVSRVLAMTLLGAWFWLSSATGIGFIALEVSQSFRQGAVSVASILLLVPSAISDGRPIEQWLFNQQPPHTLGGWLWNLWLGLLILGALSNLLEAILLQAILQGELLSAAYWADPWNYVDMASSLAIGAFVATHFKDYPAEIELSLLTVIVLLFALRLLQTASLHPTVGPLILAVMKMFSDISMFLCLYVYILLVFAGVFTLLSSDEDHQYFGSFGKATLILFYAGLGEFSDPLNNAIESHNTLGTVLLLTYVILSSIILLNLLIGLMASTWGDIEKTQAAQYQLLRIRVLNEYSTMPWRERIPPPFNLIAVVMSGPLRCVASLISECCRQQSALCRIAFWSMKAVYSTIDALVYTMAFAPSFFCPALRRGLETGFYCGLYCAGKMPPQLSLLAEVLKILIFYVGLIAFGPVLFLMKILQLPVIIVRTELLDEPAERGGEAADVEETEGDEARKGREATDRIKEKIDKWIETTSHHDANFPDVMAGLMAIDRRQVEMEERQLQGDERQMRGDERLTQVDERQMQMDKRQVQMEERLERRLAEMETLMKEIRAKLN
ncbi:unnamed protein product [Vitrella brassicaformis CCMP3155]|uniref:Ion transport domain-containing protein n=2 Tax=Vitrella brassicaformis TaxID=1169539 RepID=A0A0G4EIM8_VITBC|nr:unnamed protein product [Vitrella brassicaformis CCMP3155]|eukprot:CEL96858.1 unnamed protein product [Vitrella brassicaformis CCMP3155]